MSITSETQKNNVLQVLLTYNVPPVPNEALGDKFSPFRPVTGLVISWSFSGAQFTATFAGHSVADIVSGHPVSFY